jgi:hypothetical protein
MTINEERVSSVAQTRRFLLDLLIPSLTPKVPKTIRMRARSLLRHFPSPYEAERAWPPQFDPPRYSSGSR